MSILNCLCWTARQNFKTTLIVPSSSAKPQLRLQSMAISISGLQKRWPVTKLGSSTSMALSAI